MDDNMMVLFMGALYAQLGRAENLRWRRWRSNWLRKHVKRPYCWVCGDRVWFNRDKSDSLNPKKRATIDHIVPKSYIERFIWSDLVYEELNYELMCLECNAEKSFYFPKELSTELLQKLQAAANNSEHTPPKVRKLLN